MSLGRRTVAAFATSVFVLTAAAPTWAQTPGALSDLVNARAGQAEGELQRRGYQATDRSEVVGDGRLTWWRKGDDCVAIITAGTLWFLWVQSAWFAQKLDVTRARGAVLAGWAMARAVAYMLAILIPVALF